MKTNRQIEEVKFILNSWAGENIEDTDVFYDIKTNIFGKVKEVQLSTMKPGIIIGKEGKIIEKLRKELPNIKVKIKDLYCKRLNTKKYTEYLMNKFADKELVE